MLENATKFELKPLNPRFPVREYLYLPTYLPTYLSSQSESNHDQIRAYLSTYLLT